MVTKHSDSLLTATIPLQDLHSDSLLALSYALIISRLLRLSLTSCLNIIFLDSYVFCLSLLSAGILLKPTRRLKFRPQDVCMPPLSSLSTNHIPISSPWVAKMKKGRYWMKYGHITYRLCAEFNILLFYVSQSCFKLHPLTCLAKCLLTSLPARSSLLICVHFWDSSGIHFSTPAPLAHLGTQSPTKSSQGCPLCPTHTQN